MYEYESKETKKSRFGVKVIALLLAAAVLAGGAGGAAGYLLGSRPSEPAAMSTESAAAQPESVQFDAPAVIQAESLADNGLDLAPTHSQKLDPAAVYEQNVSAVAGIRIEGISTNVWGQSSRFAASGSGFIITTDGYVVTNHHVIENANSITVTLTSGEEYDAELVGSDAENDVALLKIDGKNLPVVAIGNSDELGVGDMVAAIGNPLGELTNTLTVGYVSALDREINTDGTPINMLQTDAAINSGNSGGPLFDMYGNVIGITTAKYASSFVEGLGFAIPINDAMYIVYDLYEYGYVTSRPWLGIHTRDLDSVTASYYSLPVGVYVGEIDADSAAEKAGMEPGDIIIALDDREVHNYNALTAALRHYHAGDSATIKVYRGGAEVELRIVFDERQPETDEEEEPEEPADSARIFPRSGEIR